MTTFEKIMVLISALNFFAVLIGFIFASWQVRSAKLEIKAIVETHRENHDFQRRIAAQDAINQFNFSSLSAELGTKFGYFEHNLPISIKEIRKVFDASEENRSKLIMLLRHYEGLARGINQGIYDEEVVKSALRRTILRVSRAFSLYIEQRRIELGNPKLWKEFTDLGDRWLSEDTIIESRPKTGFLSSIPNNHSPLASARQEK